MAKKVSAYKKTVVTATLTVSSKLLAAKTIEERVNISSALAILGVAIGADKSDAMRLVSLAKKISSIE